MEETYISVDVETSGRIPGVYSMLSLGAVKVFEPEKTFYVELKPINANFEREALEVNRFSMEKLTKTGKEPEEAMYEFSVWVNEVSDNKKAVFASWGNFDWVHTWWYLERYGYGKLFGINGIDMKSYYMGMLNTKWGDTVKGKLPKEFTGDTAHSHNALNDAVEQSFIFASMLRYNEETSKNKQGVKHRVRGV